MVEALILIIKGKKTEWWNKHVGWDMWHKKSLLCDKYINSEVVNHTAKNWNVFETFMKQMRQKFSWLTFHIKMEKRIKFCYLLAFLNFCYPPIELWYASPENWEVWRCNFSSSVIYVYIWVWCVYYRCHMMHICTCQISIYFSYVINSIKWTPVRTNLIISLNINIIDVDI